jgi:hypothetical protein
LGHPACKQLIVGFLSLHDGIINVYRPRWFIVSVSLHICLYSHLHLHLHLRSGWILISISIYSWFCFSGDPLTSILSLLSTIIFFDASVWHSISCHLWTSSLMFALFFQLSKMFC